MRARAPTAPAWQRLFCPKVSMSSRWSGRRGPLDEVASRPTTSTPSVLLGRPCRARSGHYHAPGGSGRPSGSSSSPRAQVVELRTRTIAALHALVITASDRMRERLRDLSLEALVQTCSAMRGSAQQSAEEFATTMALRATAKRVQALEAEARELEAQLKALVTKAAPGLLGRTGVGTVVAAQVMASWSHKGRMGSEAAFAKLAGVAPIEASSGQTVRHRLDRSGDRQLNRALHTVVLVRIRVDPRTKAYVARRTSEGKNSKGIMRCLKRYFARQLFRELEALPPLT